MPWLYKNPILRCVFDHWHFVFFGDTKKISFTQVICRPTGIPIQALTSRLNHRGSSRPVGFSPRQVRLRFFAEDGTYPGMARLLGSVARGLSPQQQRICLSTDGSRSIAIAAICGYFNADNAVITADLTAGLEALWHAAVVLALQILWALAFVMCGKSMVTGAQISFHLRADRI